jgi:hypothetical protein
MFTFIIIIIIIIGLFAAVKVYRKSNINSHCLLIMHDLQIC